MVDLLNQDTNYEDTVNAAGALTLTVRPRNVVTWRITQVSIEMATAPAGARAVLRKNGLYVSELIPTGDAAGGDPPIYIRPGDAMTIEWTSCTPGDRGRAFVVYDQLAYS